MEFKKILTSESVGAGHPDKICDQISDKVLDECLKQDRNSKVACEVFAANRLIVIGGEITTKGYVDVVKCAWDILLPLGYSESDFTIISNVNSQSLEIFNAVQKNNNEIGAGDQGMVFGFATNETNNYMPLTINIAHDLVKFAEQLRVKKNVNFIKSDMKSQVSIDYSDENNPKIDSIVMSIQHEKNISQSVVHKFCNFVIDNVLEKYNLNNDFKRILNPSGSFVVGGPIGDTGLTGRKIIVDTYGGIAKHGGGAFSGKDATKVDRSGAYFARYIAKNIVASGIAKKCEVELSFAIGITKPISIYIDTFNTSKFSNDQLLLIVNNVFNLSISDFLQKFNMFEPIYSRLSTYGHFGREDLNVGWEKLDKVVEIKEFINKNF